MIEHAVSETMSPTLDQLEIGQKGRIAALELPGDQGTRLMEMGLIVGTTVEVARIAPLGDPIVVVVRGYQLSLRVSEAKCVKIDCQTAESDRG